MTERQAVLLIIAVTALVRFALAAVTGLGIDKSYMVSHARDLSLSYVDQPPLHVWIVGILAKVTGSENGLLLRTPFILMFAGSTWLLYRLTARLFDERAALWAVGLFNLSPFFAVAGGTWILPEGPVDFFMLAGANVVARLVVVSPEPRRPLAGVAVRRVARRAGDARQVPRRVPVRGDVGVSSHRAAGSPVPGDARPMGRRRGRPPRLRAGHRVEPAARPGRPSLPVGAARQITG